MQFLNVVSFLNMCSLDVQTKKKLKTAQTWGTDLQGLRCSLFIVAIHLIYIWPHSGPQERSVFCVNGEDIIRSSGAADQSFSLKLSMVL